MNKLILILIGFILIGCINTSMAEDWIIDGNAVYIDNSHVYISVAPHTISHSGYVIVNITSKSYSGNIDFTLLMNGSDKVVPNRVDLWNGNKYKSISNSFNKHSFEYDGTDTAYLCKNLHVLAGTTYSLRVFIDVPVNANGKYGVALKPSHLTMNEALVAGYFYYLDPWYGGLTNLLTNSDFETWTAGVSSPPTGWLTSDDGTGTYSQETSIIKNGSYSVKLTNSNTYTILYQEQSTPGNTVSTFGAWTWCDTPTTASLHLHDVVGSAVVSQFHTGSGEWEYLQVGYRTDATATLTRAHMYIYNGGTAYFDDVILVTGLIQESVNHYGADYTTTNNEAMGGEHYNIGTFTVPVGTTLRLGNNTTLTIDAQKVVIDGTIDGIGAGSIRPVAAATTGNGAGWGAAGQTGGGDFSAGGGSYGGQGGRGTDGATYTGYGGGTYGSSSDKTISVGSSGGNAEHTNSAGAGGGAIEINTPWFVMGSAGNISMNGSDGIGISWPDGAAGGGSGGTILIVTSYFNAHATSLLSVDGGKGASASGSVGGKGGGGGGGGRIKAFVIGVGTWGTMTYNGGLGGTAHVSGEAGAVGTIYQLADPTLPTYDTNGYVFKPDGTTPVVGAVVNISTYSDTTDAAGYWEITYTGASILDYEITADYYQTKTGYVYMSNTGTTSGDFTLNFGNTYLIYPQNNSEILSLFPPLTKDIIFDWTGTNAISYKIEVSRDEYYYDIVSTQSVTDSSVTIPLQNFDDYYWRIFSYDGSFYGEPTESFSFSINDTTPRTTTAIHGVVYYEGVDGSITVLGNSYVYLWNATYSTSTVTGSTGYYLFDDLTAGETYSVYATKETYDDSTISIVTTVLNKWTVQNIFMQKTVDDIFRHYVKFNVYNQSYIPLPDVTADVYIGEGVIVEFTGTTGTSGDVAFELFETVRYRIEFTNVALDIDETVYLYPHGTEYNIMIVTPSIELFDGFEYNLDLNNDSIVFTYSSDAGVLSNINMLVTNSTGTVHNEDSTLASDILTFNILNQTDEYCVNITIDSVNFDNVYINKCYMPGKRPVDLYTFSDNSKNIFSSFLLIILAMSFGARHATTGAVVIVLSALLLYTMNWITIEPAILLVATLLAIIYVMTKRGS